MTINITWRKSLKTVLLLFTLIVGYLLFSNWALIKILITPPSFYTQTEIAEEWSLKKNKYGIKGATLIRGTSEKPITNALVIIENGKIVYADTLEEKLLADLDYTLDASGKVITPGLIDGHVHLNKGTDIHLFLAAGVTTVRDVGNTSERLMKLAQLSVDHAMPQIIYSGEILRGPGGHPEASFHVYVNDSIQAIQEIEKLVENGSSVIKVTGNISPDIMRVICNKAKELGLPVAIDFLGTKSISGEQAIKMGATTIEHGGGIPQSIHNLPNGLDKRLAIMLWLYSDSTKTDKLMDLMIEQDVYLEPTFVVLRSGALSDQCGFENKGKVFTSELYRMYDELFSSSYLDRVKDPFLIQYTYLQKFTYDFYKKGGKVMAGSDLPAGGLVPGFSLQEELKEFQKIGLDNFSILKSATYNNAEALGILEEVGTLEKGKIADLLILNKNPLEDINYVENIDFVIKEGVAYRPEKILSAK